jgi:hypothetical protein
MEMELIFIIVYKQDQDKWECKFYTSNYHLNDALLLHRAFKHIFRVCPKVP